MLMHILLSLIKFIHVDMYQRNFRKISSSILPSYLWSPGPKKCHPVKAEGQMDLNLRNLPWKRSVGALTSTRLKTWGRYREARTWKTTKKCGFDSINYSLFTTEIWCQVISVGSYRKKIMMIMWKTPAKIKNTGIFTSFWSRFGFAPGALTKESHRRFFCETGRHGCKAPSACCRIVRHLTRWQSDVWNKCQCALIYLCMWM